MIFTPEDEGTSQETVSFKMIEVDEEWNNWCKKTYKIRIKTITNSL
jgi:hypothetical protein